MTGEIQDVVTVVPEFEGSRQVLSTDEVQVFLDSYNMTSQQVMILYSGIKALEDIIGMPLNRLETQSKTSIIDAINSVLSEVDLNTIIGPLYELTTGDKTNIVAAINWLNEDKTSWDDFSPYFRSFFNVANVEEFRSKLAPWQMTQIDGLTAVINGLNSGKVSWNDLSPFIQIFLAASTKRAAQDTLSGWEISDIVGLQEILDSKADDSDLVGKEDKSNKGATNGYAPLDVLRLVPLNNIPPQAITRVFSANSDAEMTALIAYQGSICTRDDSGKTFMLREEPASIRANWTQIGMTSSAVTSVDGQTGAVNLSTKYLKNESNSVSASNWTNSSVGLASGRFWVQSLSSSWQDLSLDSVLKYGYKRVQELPNTSVITGPMHEQFIKLTGIYYTLQNVPLNQASNSLAPTALNIFNGWRVWIMGNATSNATITPPSGYTIDGNPTAIIPMGKTIGLVFDGTSFSTFASSSSGGGGGAVTSVDGQTGNVILSENYVSKIAHPSINTYATGMFALPFTDLTFQEYSLKKIKKYIDPVIINTTASSFTLDGTHHGKTISLDWIPTSNTPVIALGTVSFNNLFSNKTAEGLALDYTGIFAGWEVTLINNSTSQYGDPPYENRQTLWTVVFPGQYTLDNDNSTVKERKVPAGHSIKITFNGSKFITEFIRPESITTSMIEKIPANTVLANGSDFYMGDVPASPSPMTFSSLERNLVLIEPPLTFNAIKMAVSPRPPYEYYDIDVSKYYTRYDLERTIVVNKPLKINLRFTQPNTSEGTFFRYTTSNGVVEQQYINNTDYGGADIGELTGTRTFEITTAYTIPAKGPKGWQSLCNDYYDAAYELYYDIPPEARLLRMSGYIATSNGGNSVLKVSFDPTNGWNTNQSCWQMKQIIGEPIYISPAPQANPSGGLLTPSCTNEAFIPMFEAMLTTNKELNSMPTYQARSQGLTKDLTTFSGGFFDNGSTRPQVKAVGFGAASGYITRAYICIDYIT